MCQQFSGRHSQWTPPASSAHLYFHLNLSELCRSFPSLTCLPPFHPSIRYDESDENGVLSVNYGGFAPVLVEGLKELKQQQQLEMEEVRALAQQQQMETGGLKELALEQQKQIEGLEELALQQKIEIESLKKLAHQLIESQSEQHQQLVDVL